MKLRRCRILFVDRRAVDELVLEDLLSGGTGIGQRDCWIAMAPHVGTEVELQAADLAILEAVACDVPVEREALERRFDPGRVARLVETGLLLGEHAAHEEWTKRDAEFRRLCWWPPAAVAQVFGRWRDVDIEADEKTHGRRQLSAMVARNGLPPAAAPRRAPIAAGLALPTPRRTGIDDLLAKRSTCRNFDMAKSVPLADLADLLARVFGSQEERTLVPDVIALKKNSPSGGGLHPVEAYVLAQRVDGLATGLYHYHCTSHSLEPLRELDADGSARAAHALVAGQPWFATAPVLLLMAARFERNFWKYRHHPKAWKVIQLDAGHLSQNVYLTATEQGHGVFVTGAINDVFAEELFALDGVAEGAIAVCGFGPGDTSGPFREFATMGTPVERRV